MLGRIRYLRKHEQKVVTLVQQQSLMPICSGNQLNKVARESQLALSQSFKTSLTQTHKQKTVKL